jgi:fatty acid desaturase
MEGHEMANTPDTNKSSAMRAFDTVLVVAGILAAVMVGLWAFHAIVGIVLWVFKIAILAVIVIFLVRLLTRSRRS